MSSKLIGHVGVDSGQLLLCDPCYIDSEWKQEDFEDIRIYEHNVTNDQLQYRVDFINYQQAIQKYGGKSMNELLETGEWRERPGENLPKHNFSYNACAKATLSDDGHGQLYYKHGHPGVGVAFSTAFGDGVYPVIAHYHSDGTLRSVEVVFQNDEEEDPFDNVDDWDDEIDD